MTIIDESTNFLQDSIEHISVKQFQEISTHLTPLFLVHRLDRQEFQ